MKKYLEYFEFPTRDMEADYILSYPYKLEMQCYSDNVYPFSFLPDRGVRRLEFENLTLLCGGNGSGKSTCLNIIAEKLKLERGAPFNNTPFFEEYLKLCSYPEYGGTHRVTGRIITSDDVFDYLLNLRSINEGISNRREALFAEYDALNNSHFTLKSLDDYDALRESNDAKRKTKSAFCAKRLSREIRGQSNGESALSFFTSKIRENGLYLLDEPENSLSIENQIKLVGFIEDSVRFFGCQFIISTHSPFFLASRGAKIFDLDFGECAVRNWTELKNVRLYHDFFERHRSEFK